MLLVMGQLQWHCKWGFKHGNVFQDASSEVFSVGGKVLISLYKAVVKTLFRTEHARQKG